MQEFRLRSRRDDLSELRGPGQRLLIVDHDLRAFGGGQVAQGAHEQVRLGVEQSRPGALAPSRLHVLPQALQVGQVAFEFGLGPVKPGCADDEPEALGQVQLVEHLAHLPADLLVLDLARDTDAVHLRHHDQVPTGDRDVAGQRGSLRAHALLEHLDHDFLPLLEAFLEERAFAARGLVADPLGRLHVFAGEVARVEVGDVEEPVLFDAEIDERRLDRRFDVGDDAEVDIADARGGGAGFSVQLLEPTVLDQRDTALLAGDIVDEHLSCGHKSSRIDSASEVRPRRHRRGGIRPGLRAGILTVQASRTAIRRWRSGVACAMRPGGPTRGRPAKRGGCTPRFATPKFFFPDSAGG